MEPKHELPPANYTPTEQAELEKSRTISDRELLEGGMRDSMNEKMEKELLLGEYNIKRLERLNHPYFKFLLKYFDTQTMESIVRSAEKANDINEINHIIETRWNPLLKQLEEDPEFQEDYHLPKGLKISVSSGVWHTLDALSFFDKTNFDDLRYRALQVGNRIRREDRSQNLDF